MKPYRLVTNFIILLCCILLTAESQSVFAQPSTDNIAAKMLHYQQKLPASVLFLHFDKTVYTNNESAWFTAYLLNSKDAAPHNTLSVMLVNDLDHRVQLTEKFSMAGSISTGSVLLPDSIPPGNYTFVAYTNRIRNREPEVTFKQCITVKNTTPANFKAMLSSADTSASLAGKPRSVILNVNGNDYLPVSGATVNYSLLGNGKQPVKGRAKTDKAGQYRFNLVPGQRQVSLQVINKKSSQYITYALPQTAEEVQVRFYPEGGSLINKIPTSVGWETQISNGHPLRATGVLYKNGSAVDTLQTDSYGMGNFVLVPDAGAKYEVKLLGHYSAKDRSFTLPTVQASGVNIRALHAVVNDTLQLQLTSSSNRNVLVHVHNYATNYYTVAVKLTSLMPRKVKIALAPLAKGIAEVTVTDSLARPFAERLFFAHYNKRTKLTIAADKNTYSTRDKITLSLQLSKGVDDTKGFVSVACVQDNRFEQKKINDIESYFYLKNNFASLPLKDNVMGTGTADLIYLENVLLVKGWRRYTWPDLIKTDTLSPVAQSATLALSGKVTHWGKPLKKPAVLMLFRDSTSSMVATDSAGLFALSAEEQLNTQDKPLKFFVNADQGQQLEIVNPYDELNKKLAENLEDADAEIIVPVQTSDAHDLKGFEHAIRLAEAKVVAVKDRTLYGKGKVEYIQGTCNDYICFYGVVNCRNHPFGGTPLVPGETYNGRVYIGCGGLPPQDAKGKKIFTLPAVYVAKEFNGSDYSVANPSAPEYVSTIYWKNIVIINAELPTKLSFYASDITGRFRIVVQGVTDHGVVYGQSYININKK